MRILAEDSHPMDQSGTFAPPGSWIADLFILFVFYFICLISQPFSFEIACALFVLSQRIRKSVHKFSFFWVILIVSSSVTMWISLPSEILNLSLIQFLFPSAKFLSPDASGFMSAANGTVFVVLAALPSIAQDHPIPHAAKRSNAEVLGATAVVAPLSLALKINALIVWLGVTQEPGRFGIVLTNDVQTDPLVVLFLAGATLAAGASIGASVKIIKLHFSRK
jgi:hypothetical protein